MQFQKKIIQIFKSFIQKALVPQIKKMEGSLFEWNKFNQMITQETINYTELQQFVDSLTPIPGLISPQFERKDNLSRYSKKRQDEQLSPSITSFNPSKTFGGDRARIMFPFKNEIDDSGAIERKEYTFATKEFGSNKNLASQQFAWQGINAQSLLPGLQKLSKMFAQSQSKIEGTLGLVGSNGNQPFVTQFVSNKPMY